ncbi:MAG: hypothetical protein MUF73_18900 [Rhodobacteraceae bacterium]|jgi:hypothetical protein|nr:hypothetical protein [Paracoccaceae bacterium]
MADPNHVKFDRRLERILRDHRKRSRGYVTTVNHDGLLIARPKRAVGSTALLRGLLLCLATFVVLKAVLYVRLGPEAYAARTVQLDGGSIPDRIGAWAMTMDPATLWLATQIQGLVGG